MSRRSLPCPVAAPVLLPVAALFVALAGADPARAGFVRFDETTDTISFPGNTTSTGFTVEARVRFCGPIPTSSPYSVIWTEQFDGLEDRSLTGGTAGFGGSGYPIALHTIQGTIAKDVWHHMVWQVAGGRKTLYFDGTRLIDIPIAGSVTTAPGSVSNIGAFKEPAGMQRFRASMLGDLDFIRVSSGARYSGPSITVLTADPPTDGTTLFNFGFNESTGSPTVADSGPNGWTGTLGTGFIGATSPSLMTDDGACRFIQVTGSVSVLGRITIETFNKPTFPRGGSSSTGVQPNGTAAMEMASITVTPGMKQVQVAQMIRDSLDIQLSSSWVPGIYEPGLVVLFNPDAFTLNVANTAGGVTVTEVAAPGTSVPTLAEWGMIALAGAVFITGVTTLRRRRRPGATG